ncbi:phosphoenolpyruvate carboxylase [Vaginella massiliensis]|uniref:phosphoenolpyruvate carboxylase n=1 Tax=Vaginella massiliensis TaxID=1816680 RepID=UPI000837BD09|nr:phosphoenolpyruvate carboxylase [Vaginella massiliensis]
MNKTAAVNQKFHQSVENKYQIYNSLFMNLPYENMFNIGSLIPFLYEESKLGFESGKSPEEIIHHFFEKYTDIQNEAERLDLMFRMIQYIERQVVLFDSIEDAAFSKLFPANGKGSLESIYLIALQQGKLEKVKSKIQDFITRVVFTAHPTQFYPTEVQQIIQDLRNAIREDSVSKIDLLLQQLGQTPFFNEQRPTPYDEALSIIYYLKNVYYHAISDLNQKIKTIFFPNEELQSPIIQLGFWPGGDRDGNPFVTYETTKKVAQTLRTALLKNYYDDVKFLQRRLTFKQVKEPLKQLRDRIYHDLYRDEGTLTLEEIKMRLAQVRQFLIEFHNGIFLSLLDEFIQKIHIFGLHFASLDIRQDARVHENIVCEIVEHYTGINLEDLEESERIELMINPSFTVKAEDFTNPLIIDTIKNIRQLKQIQTLNGELGTHRYIISNSENLFDVLNVMALFRFCGYALDEIHFDIMPLFETIAGMENAEQTMEKLFTLPVYVAHLRRRKQGQSIMLGFSDGTKDGGYIKANWEIYRTKEVLTRISQNHGVKVIFFDGRGGPPARGGGKTHEFYATQGKTIENHQIQITIQGQTITSNYGTLEQSQYNFEQLFTAGIIASVFDEDLLEIDHDQRLLIEELANISYQHYSELKAHPSFLPYLENMSTLKYYGNTNIGSRPSKRGNDERMKFEDLRAIPFVGSWSLLKQNIPGYYGVGYALQTMKQQGRLDEVKKLFREVGFFRTLILNSMMSMQKTYFPLTAYMKDDPEYGEFWKMLYDEYELSKDLSLEVSGLQSLMEDEPINRASVLMREKIVLPLLTIQQYALDKIHRNADLKSAYEKMVTRALFGNINAGRNSA